MVVVWNCSISLFKDEIRNPGMAYRGGSASGYLTRLQSFQGLSGARESPPELTVVIVGRSQFLADYSLEASVPYHMALFIGLLTRGSMLTPENVMRERENKRASKMETAFFHNLISEVTYHHFSYILLVM